jgi:hypothetical protein
LTSGTTWQNCNGAAKKSEFSATDYNLDLALQGQLMDSLWHKPTSEALPTCPITQVIKNERSTNSKRF